MASPEHQRHKPGACLVPRLFFWPAAHVSIACTAGPLRCMTAPDVPPDFLAQLVEHPQGGSAFSTAVAVIDPAALPLLSAAGSAVHHSQ